MLRTCCCTWNSKADSNLSSFSLPTIMTNLEFRPYFTFTQPNVRRRRCRRVLPTCEGVSGVTAMATEGFFARGTPVCVEAPGHTCPRGFEAVPSPLQAADGFGLRHGEFSDLHERGPEPVCRSVEFKTLSTCLRRCRATSF